MSFYGQDQWKATPKLTVNIGLRYDRTSSRPTDGRTLSARTEELKTGEINFNNGTYVLQQLPPSCKDRGFAPCIPGDGTLPANVVVDPRGKIFHDTTTNWGPRLGLAYRIGQRTAD